MNGSNTKPERVYTGVRALRNRMAEYVAKAGAGALVIVRDRNKRVLAVMTSEGIACAGGVERLPPEIYAAYFLHREALALISAILHRVTPLTAQQIVQAASEIEAAAKLPKRKATTEPTPASSEPQPEPADLKEERIRAQARARTKAAAEKRDREKLAEMMGRDIKPVNIEALSIRHTVKE